jgi:MoaA/NifB/PqqE/SkfB family radical SAM enzyme
MSLPKTICGLPWISIETSPIGTARPCCLADDEITKPDGTKYKLTEHTLEEIYASEYMQDLRQQFRRGEKPATCKRCWAEEDAGRDSKRINSEVRLRDLYKQIDWDNDTPDQLWFIDLKLGNICNLKCRICGSWSSSKWAQEEIDYVTSDNDNKNHLARTMLKEGQWPRKSQDFWQNLETLLPNIKYFEFTGGEPFLIREHFDLLKTAIKTGDSKHIDIHYNTNATTWDEEFVDIWREFGRVDIAFSIDNVGRRFEYERYGAKWDRAEEIIKRVHEVQKEVTNITTQLCFTINIQNVYYINELLDWADEQGFGNVYFNMLHDPAEMCIKNMTPEAQALVKLKLQAHDWKPEYQQEVNNVIRFIENGSGDKLPMFDERMYLADKWRKEKFTDTHPEIAQAMGYEI